MPRTVNDVSRLFGVPLETVRYWCDNFAGFLSPTATPSANKAGIFTDDDLAVLALVAQMHEVHTSFEGIRKALDRGERGELPQQDRTEEEASSPIVTRFVGALAKLEGELEAVRGERDYLRERLEEIQDKLIEAEKRAAAAEARSDLLQPQASSKQDQDQQD